MQVLSVIKYEKGSVMNIRSHLEKLLQVSTMLECNIAAF